LQLLTVDEVADRLRTTRSGVYAGRYRGTAPFDRAIKVGAKVLWPAEAINTWLQEQATAAERIAQGLPATVEDAAALARVAAVVAVGGDAG
jgi:predicted DNA-binding transcriptional regulator AlpA